MAKHKGIHKIENRILRPRESDTHTYSYSILACLRTIFSYSKSINVDMHVYVQVRKFVALNYYNKNFLYLFKQQLYGDMKSNHRS